MCGGLTSGTSHRHCPFRPSTWVIVLRVRCVRRTDTSLRSRLYTPTLSYPTAGEPPSSHPAPEVGVDPEDGRGARGPKHQPPVCPQEHPTNQRLRKRQRNSADLRRRRRIPVQSISRGTTEKKDGVLSPVELLVSTVNTTFFPFVLGNVDELVFSGLSVLQT